VPKYNRATDYTPYTDCGVFVATVMVMSGVDTFIYTGDYTGGDGKTYNAVSASLGDHPPQASRVYFSDWRGHYTVARIKK
jgi:hypothetical protein